MAAPTSTRRRFHRGRGRSARVARLTSARIPAPQTNVFGNAYGDEEAGRPSSTARPDAQARSRRSQGLRLGQPSARCFAVLAEIPCPPKWQTSAYASSPAIAIPISENLPRDAFGSTAPRRIASGIARWPIDVAAGASAAPRRPEARIEPAALRSCRHPERKQYVDIGPRKTTGRYHQAVSTTSGDSAMIATAISDLVRHPVSRRAAPEEHQNEDPRD